MEWGKELMRKDVNGTIRQLLSEDWNSEKGLKELTMDEREIDAIL